MANESLSQLSDALGIATAQLSGDPQRMQMALGMQQSRKLQEQDRQWNEWIDVNVKDQGKAKLLRLMGREAGIKSILGSQDADETEFERARKEYLKLMEIPLEGRTTTQNRDVAILENKIFGAPRVIPFFSAEGENVESITSRDLAMNPNILKQKQDEGLFTVGQSPAVGVKGAKSPINLIRDNYLETKGQVDTINDLANIIYENRDTFSLAGSIANLVNDARYQIKSADRLANLDKFRVGDPKRYKELETFLDKEYGENLDKISQDRAVAKSIFLRLAYGTAKEIDPSGRLSDNDVKIAMDIIGQLGANWKSNLATLENLTNQSTRSYNDAYNIRTKRLTDDKELIEAKEYQNLPQFLQGQDWRQGLNATSSTATDVDELVNFYKSK